MSLSDEINSFKERHGLLVVAERLGLHFQREGRSFRLAEDHSVVIFPSGSDYRWKDHGRTKAGGDHIDLIQHVRKLDSKVEALRYGCTLFSEQCYYKPRTPKPRKRNTKTLCRDEWLEKIAKSRSLPNAKLLGKMPLLKPVKMHGRIENAYWGLADAGEDPIQYRRADGKTLRDGRKASRIRGENRGIVGLSYLDEQTECIHLTEGETDALSVWTLLEDHLTRFLDKQRMVVCFGVGNRMRNEWVEKLRRHPVRVYAQNDAEGLEWAHDCYLKLSFAGCDVRVIVPSTRGSDWGDYYQKAKFLISEYDADSMVNFNKVIDSTINWEYRHKSSWHDYDRKIHQDNGAKGGRPARPERALVEKLLSDNPELSPSEVCPLVGMVNNSSNKRTIRRWAQAVRNGI